MSRSTGTVIVCKRCGHEYRRRVVDVERVNDLRAVLDEYEALPSDKRRVVSAAVLASELRDALDPAGKPERDRKVA